MNLERLQIGSSFTKEEIEEIFSTRFGYRINGINPRNLEDGTKAILLFTSVSGPYSDRTVGDIIYYIGEGEKGDQKLTNANKALISSNSDGRVIYGFEKLDPNSSKRIYLGILKLIDYDYITQGDRKVYEFKIQKIEAVSNNELLENKLILEDQVLNTLPQLTQDRDTKQNYRIIKVRSVAFKTKVKEIYGDSCAVCGARRYNKAQNPEVEAAHIYPVEKNGSDDLRNGLSLCKLHHWAFDGGLFIIEDNFEIKVLPSIIGDINYEQIYKFEGKKLNLPKNSKFYPDQIFLSEHRKIHGF